jgi:hypothetical protein
MCEYCNLFLKLCNTLLIRRLHLCFVIIQLQNKFIIMPILTVVLVLIGVGVILWLINAFIPMQHTIKNILNAVVVIVVVVWLLKIFGVLSTLQQIHI